MIVRRLLEAAAPRATAILATIAVLALMARFLSSKDFLDLQTLLAAVGLAGSLADAGFSLEVTRVSSQPSRAQQVPRLFATRLSLFLVGAMALSVLGTWQLSWILWLVAYQLTNLLRSHVVAQVRGATGVDFELTVGQWTTLIQRVPIALACLTASAYFVAVAFFVGAMLSTVALVAKAPNPASLDLSLRRPLSVYDAFAISSRAGPAQFAGFAPNLATLAAGTLPAGEVATSIVAALRGAEMAWRTLGPMAILSRHASLSNRALPRQRLTIQPRIAAGLLLPIGLGVAAVVSGPTTLSKSFVLLPTFVVLIALVVSFLLSADIHVLHAVGRAQPLLTWLLTGLSLAALGITASIAPRILIGSNSLLLVALFVVGLIGIRATGWVSVRRLDFSSA